MLQGESFYNSRIPGVIDELDKMGIVTNSDGAKCIFTPLCKPAAEGGKGLPPLMVQKSDGGYGYDSTDVAAIKYRLKELDADWLVYVTDLGQQTHFDSVFAAARMAGWDDKGAAKGKARLDHVGFGVVCGKDKKRFKTRSGTTVRLVDLLDEAVNRVQAVIQGRKADGKTELDDAAIDDAAKAIGYGAVKYMDMRQDRVKNYVFSYERMLSLEGETAVYLSYAHARICSIQRKAAAGAGHADAAAYLAALRGGGAAVEITHKLERALLVKVLSFSNVVAGVMRKWQLNNLTKYLYELSTGLSEFYSAGKSDAALRVVGTPQQDSRVLLLELVATAIRTGLGLLGIRALRRL